VVDRVNLLELFKFAGNDYQCPNVWGYEQTQTNRQHSLEHAISIMSGLSAVGFKATCAHEYTHAWLDEHLSPARSESLSRDSNEAFCELIAYLLMNSLGETEAVNQIKRNAYTRGQILLFIEAEQRFGVSDVIDWVQYGTDSSLREGELARVRSVELPRNGTPRSPAARPAPIVFADPPPSTAPDTLILKGISGTRARPMALINDATFEANEKGKVRLGKTNVTIRCLSISAEAVRIQLVGSNQEQELRLRTTHP
jgi:hypothetical protein